MRRALTTAAVVALSLSANACESTQSKSAKLEAKAGKLRKERGLHVGRASPDVRIVKTAVLSDANGSAVAVELRNTSSRTLVNVPIEIELRDGAGHRVFRNDAPGLATSLTHIAALPPGARVIWVNDQVTPTAKPTRAEAVAGAVAAGQATAPSSLPRVELTAPKLVSDPIDGLAARGFAINRSRVDQRQLFIYCIARKGGRIVAAGRGAITRLKAGKRSRYTIFFIGDPRGATLELAAPPTVIA